MEEKVNDFIMLSKIKNYTKCRFSRVEKGLWVFSSFGGHYSDNPKYISQKLYELCPDTKIVWLVKKEYLSSLPEYVIGVDINSDEAVNYRAKAQIVVDNVYGERAFSRMSNSLGDRVKACAFRFLNGKKTQKTYTTWHGTPLKRMGRDQIGNTVYDFSCPHTTMMLGNRFTLDIMQHLTFNKLKMELLGTPRNDILFADEDKARETRERLGLPSDRKLLLYAPTFRNDGKDTEGKNLQRSGLDQLNEIDFDRLFKTLNEKFGGEWAFVCRFHYHVAKMVDWEGLNAKYEGRFINGNLHDDMSEYMLCADILMTDASSCMFDYSVSYKPCFLYFPDLDNYKNKERGFYIEVEELPYPVAVSFDELESNIKNFDADRYRAKTDEMLERFGYVDDANSSERIVRFILGDQK